MTIHEPGLLPESKIYFWTATEFARSALLYVESGGIYRCDENFVSRPACTQMYALVWVQDGEIQLQFDNKEYKIKGNTVFAADYRQPYCYRVLDKAHFSWIHFNGVNCDPYFRFMEENGKWIVSGEESTGAAQVMQNLLEGLQAENIHDSQISVYLQDIFNKMILPCRNDGSAAYDAVIEEAVRYIDGHFQEELSLERIADQVKLSSFHFARVFKKNTNITPHEYLLNVRIQNAKKMLYYSSESVEEIAKSCGFNSTSHFIRVFKKYTNITPKQFRQVQV